MNVVCLRGRLVRDVEVRFSTNGNAVANFTMAVNKQTKNDKGEYEANFINCVIFNKSAEFMQKYTNKGDMVEITGALQTSNYQDKDGKTIHKTEVVADKIELVSSKKESMPF